MQEDLLFSSNLEATAKGEDVFAKVDEYFAKHTLSYQNLVACCYDGAASMMGKNLGFNTRFKRVSPTLQNNSLHSSPTSTGSP